jgi:hypothetical protein
MQTYKPTMAGNESDAMQNRIALQLLNRHDHNPSDKSPLTRESCGACVLGGYIPRYMAGEEGYKKSDGPNYAGWARVYIQARRVIPRKWNKAFHAELESDNTAYASALQRDIEVFGVTFE